MKIENIRVEDLHPYERNPRKNDAAVGPVAESIRQFGFKVPIIIDRNNEIIAGHTRLKAAAEKAAAERWTLSEREWEIVRSLKE